MSTSTNPSFMAKNIRAVIENTKSFIPNRSDYFIIVGIAVSGLAAFVTTYDAISNISAEYTACAETGNLKKELDTQFIVITVLSSITVVIGIVMGFLLNDQKYNILTLGIITAGIFGILYALTIKLQSASSKIKVIAAWTTFFLFLFLGWFVKRNSKGEFVGKQETEMTTF